MFLIELILTYALYIHTSATVNVFLASALGAFGFGWAVINVITLVLLFVASISICDLGRDLLDRI